MPFHFICVDLQGVLQKQEYNLTLLCVYVYIHTCTYIHTYIDTYIHTPVMESGVKSVSLSFICTPQNSTYKAYYCKNKYENNFKCSKHPMLAQSKILFWGYKI